MQVCLASLEGAEHGVAFSSGLGATTTLMHLLSPGDRVVLIADVYGGVYRMTSQVYEPKGYVFEYLPAAEFPNLRERLDERTRMVWIETPSNPMLNVVDIAAAAEAAHEVGAILVVDNTFASPFLQQPLALGADVVVHSTTKYLSGHSDVIGGFVATNDPTIAERLFFLQKSLGAVPGPFDCWLVLRGVKTLALRMRKHCENARAVAGWLDEQPAVERVLYPGLPAHPGHEIAAAADARLRRDDLVPGRLGGGGGRARRPHEVVPAGGVARRRRKPDRTPRADDARVDGRRALRRAEEPDPALGRDRVGGRPDRRPGNRARPLDGDRRRVRLREPLDLLHQGVERSIGVYLLETSDGPALFDCGPSTTLDALKRGLRERGLELTDVRHLLLSHIHLDHAGAAGVIVREHPELRVHVSEVGAPHLVEPSRLEASSRRLYGETFDRLWGELAPVPEANVEVVGDDVLGLDVLPDSRARVPPRLLPRRRGDAVHGDVCGVRILPERLVIPPVPPPEVDVEAWDASLDEIERRAPARLALIHFGVVEDDVSRHLRELRARLHAWEEWVERGASEEQFEEAMRGDIEAELGRSARRLPLGRAAGLRIRG